MRVHPHHARVGARLEDAGHRAGGEGVVPAENEGELARRRRLVHGFEDHLVRPAHCARRGRVDSAALRRQGSRRRRRGARAGRVAAGGRRRVTARTRAPAWEFLAFPPSLAGSATGSLAVGPGKLRSPAPRQRSQRGTVRQCFHEAQLTQCGRTLLFHAPLQLCQGLMQSCRARWGRLSVPRPRQPGPTGQPSTNQRHGSSAGPCLCPPAAARASSARRSRYMSLAAPKRAGAGPAPGSPWPSLRPKRSGSPPALAPPCVWPPGTRLARIHRIGAAQCGSRRTSQGIALVAALLWWSLSTDRT